MIQRVSTTIGLQEAQRAIDAILRALDKDQEARGISIAVVDDGGEPIAVVRTDTARAITVETAIRKAYTSVRRQMPSGVVTERLRDIDPNIAAFVMSDPRMLPIGGGLCITKPGTQQCVGGIAVSGLPAGVDDEALAQIGLQAMDLRPD